MASVFLRTVIIYLILIAAIRLMGKRQIGELEVSELVITFMLSELAVNPISDKRISIFHAIIPILILLSAEVILSFFVSRSAVFKKIMFGKPSIVIRNGVIDQKELSRQRISVSEFISELRLNGISSVSDVEYAIIEDNGKLSVFPKKSKQPLTPEDVNIEIQSKGITHCVIIDGKLCKDSLAFSGKDSMWLQSKLKSKHADIKDVYLMTVDDSGDSLIIMKGNQK